MHPIFWKSLTALLVLCILVQQFGGGLWSRYGLRKEPDHRRGAARVDTHQQPTSRPNLWHWSFDWQRDHRNSALSEEQCDVAFPKLYDEISRSMTHWQQRNITPESIELFDRNEAGVRVLLADQQLRIMRTKGMGRDDFRKRIFAVLHQLQRAVTSVQAIDDPFHDTEFTIVVDDYPNYPKDRELALWSFTRAYGDPQHNNTWVIPDFNFWSSPPVAGAFAEMQARARARDSPIAEKEQKAVWRGVQWTAPILRGALINATRHQPWADVKAMDWNGKPDVMALDELCRYAYLVNTEGRSYSSRLTYMLNCDSIPVVHEMGWAGHYYHLFVDGDNFVSVNRNFSDLGEKINNYIENPAAAQSIADHARVTFRERYTTPAATACYWRRLLRSWSYVAFTPEVYEEVNGTHPESATQTKTRGITFDEFVLHDSHKDYPYE